MTKPLILITGCSSGIGLATAHVLRENGWHVLASVRQEKDIAALTELGFETILLDYAKSSSLTAARDYLLEHHGGRIDALFNNGAYAQPGAVEDLPRAALSALFDTNLFGVHELTMLLIPLMRAAGKGRILNCSSVLGLVAAPWRGAYVSSKYALEGLTDTMRLELKETGISCVLINPGPITSRIRQNSIHHFERHVDWKNSIRKEQYEHTLIKRLYGPNEPDRFELPAKAVGDVVLKALSAKKPRARYYITRPTWIAAILKRILTAHALDRVLAKF